MTQQSRPAPGVPLVQNAFFRRVRGCPLKAVENIDHKDIALLSRFISERGRMVPSRISAVSPPKQRKLAIAIKRARFLGLLPFLSRT